jgi:RecB family endonuclease NucS
MLISRQESCDVGRLDLLARDSDGRTVITELKAGEAKDSSIGQIARYMGWYARQDGKSPRAILVASGFSEPVRYAAMAIPGLKLVTYRVQFAFDEATI